MMAGPGRHVALALHIFLVSVWTSFSQSSFAVRRQKDLSALREREGLAIRAKARSLGDKLSVQGQRTLSLVCKAADRRDWQQVWQLYSQSTTPEIQIYTAVMNAAMKCNQYNQGACVYESLCNRGINKNAASFTAAIRIFTKLGRKQKVRDVWAEAMRTCQLDQPLAGARITAAAAEGDVESAAVVLDQMKTSAVDIGIEHISSAIRACWQANGI